MLSNSNGSTSNPSVPGLGQQPAMMMGGGSECDERLVSPEGSADGISPDGDAKAVRRRERNKELARKSRQKKKVQLQQLHVHVTQLSHENIRLRDQVRTLFEAVRWFRQQHHIADSTFIPLPFAQAKHATKPPPAQNPTPTPPTAKSEQGGAQHIQLGSIMSAAEHMLMSPVAATSHHVTMLDRRSGSSELDQEAARVLTAIYHTSPRLPPSGPTTPHSSGFPAFSPSTNSIDTNEAPSPLLLPQPSAPAHQSHTQHRSRLSISTPISLPPPASQPHRGTVSAYSSPNPYPSSPSPYPSSPSPYPSECVLGDDPLLKVAKAAAAAQAEAE